MATEPEKTPGTPKRTVCPRASKGCYNRCKKPTRACVYLGHWIRSNITEFIPEKPEEYFLHWDSGLDRLLEATIEASPEAPDPMVPENIEDRTRAIVYLELRERFGYSYGDLSYITGWSPQRLHGWMRRLSAEGAPR
jgi:hypothetical protein